MRAKRQGNLDGLCGAYAIVNAISQALDRPEYMEELADHWFQAALLSLPKRDFPEVIWIGTNPGQLRLMANGVVKAIRRGTNRDLELEVDQPIKRNTSKTLAEYLYKLETLQGPATALILGIEFAQSTGGGHWTVLKKITPSEVHLLDSDGLRKLNRQAISLTGKKDRLVPKETLRIRLTKLDGEAF
ncbi:hypothetical protein [Zhengella mangrovi]|nr:hypothetical protein [Zhengella mangrovi]